MNGLDNGTKTTTMKCEPYDYKGITIKGKTIYSNHYQYDKHCLTSMMFSEQDCSWHHVKEVRKLSPYRDKNGIPLYDNDTLFYNNVLFILLYNRKLEEYVLENTTTEEQISAYHISPEDIEVEDKALFYDKHGVPVNFDTVLQYANAISPVPTKYTLRFEPILNEPILVAQMPSLTIKAATQEEISLMEVKSL